MGSVKAIPDGFHNVTPYLFVRTAAMAIDFYKKLGATFLDEWKAACLIGDALQAIAGEKQDTR